MKPEDTTPTLNKKTTKFIQEVTGAFLFYSHAINSIMLTALSAIAAKQANPTAKMLLKTKQNLDYSATNDKAIVMYQKSNIILAIHSDVSYASEPKARSMAGEHFFMSTDTTFPPIPAQFIT